MKHEGLRNALEQQFNGELDILDVEFMLIDDEISTKDHKSLKNSIIDGDVVAVKTDAGVYLELIDKVFDPDFDKKQFRSDVTKAYGQEAALSITDAKDLVEFSTIIDGDRKGNVIRGGVENIQGWALRALPQPLVSGAKREMIKEFLQRVNTEEDNDRVVAEKVKQVIRNKQRELNPEADDVEAPQDYTNSRGVKTQFSHIDPITGEVMVFRPKRKEDAGSTE